MSQDEQQSLFNAALADHDARIASRGLNVWVGSEPTFTDRFSNAPQWNTEALGGDKEQRGRDFARALARAHPGTLLLRSLGRQYPNEPLPRWSLGLYGRRDGAAIWSGPPDPLIDPDRLTPPTDSQVEAFWCALSNTLPRQLGWMVAPLRVDDLELGFRIVARTDGQSISSDQLEDAAVRRQSIHAGPISRQGLDDPLAARGLLLFSIGVKSFDDDGRSNAVACIELPAVSDVHRVCEFLAALEQATSEAQLSQLVIRGFPPPVDETVRWTTVTPDPAVIEINAAPSSNVREYYRDMSELFRVAHDCALSPLRYYYNGQRADSGGGGHITLGGATAASSPFIVSPQVVPRLIAYFNRHPALSYFFAVDHVGSSSQAPRPDEGLRDSFNELRLAIDVLRSQGSFDADLAWQTLAPFLADHTGNTHRSELNIEKLCNPYLAERGRLGLVEFRAFRMAQSPRWSAAAAALLRAITAMLHEEGASYALTDWGSALHDRFALPYYLEQDFKTVLYDLDQAGLALQPPLPKLLLDDSRRTLGQTELDGWSITVKRAIQFWPLVGNVAAQEAGSSRLVDASTLRLEVTLRPVLDTAASADGWRVVVDGYELPLREECDEEGPVLVLGLRYRSFYSQLNLHPGLRAHGPMRIDFGLEDSGKWLSVTLHEWRPDGGAYDGLPRDDRDAQRRLSERFVVQPSDPQPHCRQVPAEAVVSPYCIDLRRLAIVSRA